MKEKLVVYRLITFILLPIAGLNAISLIGLLPALAGNPLLLIGAFLQFAIVAYTFASFIFFTKGVLNGKVLKPILKDWVKLNGFITLVFAGLVLFIVLMVFLAMSGMSKAEFQKLLSDSLARLKGTPGMDKGDVADVVRQLKRTFIVAGCYSALLLTHVIITLGLLKKYAPLFSNADNKPGNDDLL